MVCSYSVDCLFTLRERECLQQLVDLGFARDRALTALIQCSWDLTPALDVLTETTVEAPAEVAPSPHSASLPVEPQSEDSLPPGDLGAAAHPPPVESEVGVSSSSATPKASVGPPPARAVHTALPHPGKGSVVLYAAPKELHQFRGYHRSSVEGLASRMDLSLERFQDLRSRQSLKMSEVESQEAALKLWEARRTGDMPIFP